MARAAPQEDWPRTVAEFAGWHARQPERWEFLDGWQRLMVPASMTHSIIKRNVAGTIWYWRRTGVVQIHSRSDALWRERFVSADTIDLDDPDIRLDVAALYAQTELSASRGATLRTEEAGTAGGSQPATYAMVGILNSAPARMPVGQRVVTAFCLV